MPTASPPPAAPQRQLLAEFERRYAGWWTAQAAAEAAERAFILRARQHELGAGEPPAPDDLRRMLDLHAAATRLQQDALQILRDAPL